MGEKLKTTPQKIETNQKVIKVCCGYYNTLILDEQQNV